MNFSAIQSMRMLPAIVIVVFATIVLADPPSTAPVAKDPTLDWLMDKKPAKSTTAPATQAATPFNSEDDGSRLGVLTMSDGKTVHGKIATTAEKPIRIWVEAEKDYEDVPFSLIKSIDANVVWERDEQEWHFKASGSDVKEYSGKSYPARETSYKVTLVNGQTIEGGIVAPLYVTEDDGSSKTFALHKRDKGEIGQTLLQLVYVKGLKFDDAK